MKFKKKNYEFFLYENLYENFKNYVLNKNVRAFRKV